MSNSATNKKTIHASCVAFGKNAVLILGQAGSGKSSLALQLMACGATLVSDDQTQVECKGDRLLAHCPNQIAGQIEARGVGILATEFQKQAIIRLAIDLDKQETDRLPVRRQMELINCTIPLLYASDTPHFPAAVMQFLKGGRIA